jgi:glycine/D-amino acid oxidase-like deaminating enzyme
MHIALVPLHSIAIIGGGFAGALTALKLLDQTQVPWQSPSSRTGTSWAAALPIVPRRPCIL